MTRLNLAVVGPRVHAGPIFDVYRLERDGTSYALKVASEPREQVDTSEVFGASAVLGGVSTVWDLMTRTGDALADARRNRQSVFYQDERHASSPGALEQEMLESEHTRVSNAGEAWNHQTLGLGWFEVPGRTRCLGLVSRWIDGNPLGTLPWASRRRAALKLLPWLWNALSAAGHGDVHPSNVIVAPNRSRFALIDPGGMVAKEWGESGASSGASGLIFTTHGAAYPVLPPYASMPVQAGMTLRQHAERFLELLTAKYHYPSMQAGALTLMRAVSPRPLLLPPESDGTPLAADWHAAGILYYAALTEHHPYAGRLVRPAWCGKLVVDSNPVELRFVLDLVEQAPPPPSSFTPEITSAEDGLALALLALRVDTRSRLVELCARAAAAIDATSSHGAE